MKSFIIKLIKLIIIKKTKKNQKGNTTTAVQETDSSTKTSSARANANDCAMQNTLLWYLNEA